MGSMDVHFSSAEEVWATPQEFFDELDKEFNFTLDPCSTDENAKCEKHFTIQDNGLVKEWAPERVFMNPPYGREIDQWMRKAYTESLHGALVVCLVPARTDTAWWHEYAAKGEVRFVRGRLKFGGAAHGAPFPSAVVVFRPPERPAPGTCGTCLKPIEDGQVTVTDSRRVEHHLWGEECAP